MNNTPQDTDPATRPELTCPLCGAQNACAIAAGRDVETCWCWGAQLDQDALAAIPDEARNRYCICAKCGGVTQEPGHDR